MGIRSLFGIVNIKQVNELYILWKHIKLNIETQAQDKIQFFSKVLNRVVFFNHKFKMELKILSNKILASYKEIWSGNLKVENDIYILTSSNTHTKKLYLNNTLIWWLNMKLK